MSDSAPPDAAARRRAVAAPGCVLVQAPAGSGKTTLLAQRFLRVLAQVDMPEGILALTFTRRAAQEMRERILHALAAAAQSKRPAALDEETWRLARAARAHMGALEIEIERHPARLRIETIDAFNAWLATQLPVTAGGATAGALREDARPLYLEAARRALSHAGPRGHGAAVERVLAFDDQRWRQLVDLIAGMLGRRDRWLPLLAGRLGSASILSDEQLAIVRRHLDEDLALLITRVLSDAHDALGAARLRQVEPLLAAAARHPGRTLEAWRSNSGPLAPDARDLERWRGLLAVCLTRQNGVRSAVDARVGFPPGTPEKPLMQSWLAQLERAPEAVSSLRHVRALPAACYSEQDWSRVRDVAEVLVLAAAELEQVFREEGTADFPAVSMGALRALGEADAPTDLNLRLDYRLKHILVDEFQDTSSAQLELLARLTAGWQEDDGRSVFCVGDPMQSIYGFRQAEVRAFLELADTGIGALRFEVQRLTSNFRSARPLIDWVNVTFGRIMPHTDDRMRGAIAFRPSKPGREVAAAEGGALRLCEFATPTAEADWIAGVIDSHRRRHPHWRIAVLVRARSHARPIARSLRLRGIAFDAADVEPLTERPAVRDVLTLLRALTHLGDRIAWLGLLRAPWAGLELADLLAVARSPHPIVWEALADRTVLARLSAPGRARWERIRPVLESALRGPGGRSVTRWLECAWLALGGASCPPDPEELAHVHALLERLKVLEQRGLPDAADLEAAVAELCASSGSARGDDPRGGGVEVTTIHKAKGLEYDCVIVPALDRHIRSSTTEFLLAHEFERAGRDGLVLAARPPIGAESTALFDFLRLKVRDAAALEAQRLLYVACTRAQRELCLTATTSLKRDDDEGDGADPADQGDAPAWRPRAGSLLAVLWPAAGPQFERPPSPASAPSAEPPAPPATPHSAQPGTPQSGPTAAAPSTGEGDVPARDATAQGQNAQGQNAQGRLLRLPLGVPLPALEAVSGPALPPGDVGREETPVFDWVGETARRVGSLVHAELQHLDLISCDADSIRAREPSYRRWLAVRGVPEERLAEAARKVTTALIGTLDDARGRWIVRRREHADFREHALSAQVGGETVHAVFDRCFVDEEGTRWVIDYKTSEHGGGGLAVFVEREVERYRPQLARYARLARLLGPEPVRVGLYFPLMRVWREWHPVS